MQRFISDDKPDPDAINSALADFGFYHALPQVQRMFAEYTNKSLLGYAGGVNEQPDEYWHDIETMELLRLWAKHVAPLPRLKQQSVFDRIRQGDSVLGEWDNG